METYLLRPLSRVNGIVFPPKLTTGFVVVPVSVGNSKITQPPLVHCLVYAKPAAPDPIDISVELGRKAPVAKSTRRSSYAGRGVEDRLPDQKLR